MSRLCLIEGLERRALLAAQFAADVDLATLRSDPGSFTTLGDSVYFLAKPSQGPSGVDLWKTDGTPAGTVFVKAFDDATGLRAAGGRLFFDVAPEGSTGVPDDLWTSDGTSAGTVLLKDFDAGANGLDAPANLVEFDGGVFFTARADGGSGHVLWVTDGTPAGTVPFGAGPADGLDPRNNGLVVSGGLLYFTASSAPNQISLWRTDGTPAGTVMLHSVLNPPNVSYSDLHLTDVNGTLFFATVPSDNSTDIELWKTDGTVAGTGVVKDLVPGSRGSLPHLLTNVAGMLYFYAAADEFGTRALWRSDGTAAGTVQVPMPADGSAPTQLSRFTALGDKLVFRGYRSDVGIEMWATDGSAGGTVLLRDITPGQWSNVPDVGGWFLVGDELYFTASDGVSGFELWKTDGTPAGTVRAADINPGAGSGMPYSRAHGFAGGAALGDRLVFGAMGEWTEHPGGQPDIEPWVSDGTQAGTFRLADINTEPQGTVFGPFLPFRDGAIFEADKRVVYSDGTQAGTTELAKVRLLNDWALTGEGRIVLNDHVAIFLASDTDFQAYSVYRSDGTRAGTYPITQQIAGGTFRYPGAMAVAGRLAYFLFGRVQSGVELWKTDGTAEGTAMVKDVVPGNGSIGPSMAALGDFVYFPAFGDQLWRSDGTEAGTVMVTDLGLPQGGVIGQMYSAGGRLHFSTGGGGTPHGFWASDGTPGGTRQLAAVSAAAKPVAFGGNIYFTGVRANDSLPNGSLYRSDGTAEGTVLVEDVGMPIHPTSLIRLGEHLYFSTADDVWRTDGTAEGTFVVADPTPDPGSASGIGWLAAWDGSLYFAAGESTAGRELYRLDVTPGCAVGMQDIYPGPTGSDPTWLTPTRNGLFFGATDPVHLRELWKVPPGRPAPAEVAGRHLFYNNSAYDGRSTAADARDDAAIAADKQSLLPGRAGGFGNVTGYSRGINGVMIDVARLPLGAGDVSAEDFELRTGRTGDPSSWAEAPAPSAVTVRRGAGVGGSDRITLTWADGAVRNTWLRVTVKPTPRTGLAREDVFYFGNLAGATGGDSSGGSGPVRVSAIDLLRTRRALFSRAPITSLMDHNRDGGVNALDLALVRANAARQLDALLGPP